MKTLRTLSTAMLLTSVLAISVSAGEIQTPPCAPGEIQTPPCAAVEAPNPGEILTPPSAAPGEIPTPPSDGAYATEIAASFMLRIVSLF